MTFHSADLLRIAADDRQAFFNQLEPSEVEFLSHHWPFWARPEQLIPSGDWVYWLPLAGRGWGKTRTGAETVREWIKTERYVNLIGATADDVRDIMIEGESGILAICPKDERPRYIANKRRLDWPNGARSLLFSAEEPDRLRGKQHAKLWADELAAWRYPDAWDQAVMGLRLGTKPQAVITTTPRPTKLIKDIVGDPLTHSTRHSTRENMANLAQSFISKVLRKYEGTRLGRQELEAEILDDVPGALWNLRNIDENRRQPKDVPLLRRVVVSIDPSATSGDSADETGLVVAGVGIDGHGYILNDRSSVMSPTEWAKLAVHLYYKHKADRIIAEVNNGGEMVETVIRVVNSNVSYRAVHASRGKVTRAEPVSALYERNMVHHVGTFAKLEDQMRTFTSDFDRGSAGYSPDRVDALVWAITELMLGVEPDVNIGMPRQV